MERPKELVELAKRLRAEWCDDNIISVGTGYGFSSDSISVDDEVKAGWNLYVWAKDPEAAKEKLPHEVEGYSVLFRGEVTTCW